MEEVKKVHKQLEAGLQSKSFKAKEAKHLLRKLMVISSEPNVKMKTGVWLTLKKIEAKFKKEESVSLLVKALLEKWNRFDKTGSTDANETVGGIKKKITPSESNPGQNSDFKQSKLGQKTGLQKNQEKSKNASAASTATQSTSKSKQSTHGGSYSHVATRTQLSTSALKRAKIPASDSDSEDIQSSSFKKLKMEQVQTKEISKMTSSVRPGPLCFKKKLAESTNKKKVLESTKNTSSLEAPTAESADPAVMLLEPKGESKKEGREEKKKIQTSEASSSTKKGNQHEEYPSSSEASSSTEEGNEHRKVPSSSVHSASRPKGRRAIFYNRYVKPAFRSRKRITVNVHPITEIVRIKCRQFLNSAITGNGNNPANSHDPTNLAKQIEDVVFLKSKAKAASYRDFIRRSILELKSNNDIRLQLLNGEISPEDYTEDKLSLSKSENPDGDLDAKVSLLSLAQYPKQCEMEGCDFVSFDRKEVINHKKTSHYVKFFKCEGCPETEFDYLELKCHHRDKHIMKLRTCPFCVKQNTFSSRDSNRRHMNRLHNAERGIYTEEGRNVIDFDMVENTGEKNLDGVLDEIGIEYDQDKLKLLKNETSVIAYDEENRSAAFVLEELQPSQPSSPKEAFDRYQFKYARDKRVKKQLHEPAMSRFRRYNRGHLASARNNRHYRKGLKQSFLFTNIVLMLKRFNEGIWQVGENLGRNLVKKFWDRVISLCGPIYKDDNIGEEVPGGFIVKVPDYFFRIYVLIKKGTVKIMPFLIPHIRNAKGLWTYKSTVEEISRLAKIKVLTKIKGEVCWDQESASAAVHCKHPRCNAVFLNVEELALHRHSDEFNCRVCRQVFPSIVKLEEHLKNHPRYKCSYCSKTFLLNYEKIRHEWSHTGKTQYKCKKCGQKYTTSHHLKVHEFKCMSSDELLASIKKPFKCSFCAKTFKSDEQKIIHERNHTGERPFNCQYCEEAFISSKSLRSHEENCQGSKKAVQLHNLAQHPSNSNSSEKSSVTVKNPLQCSFCKKTFKFSSERKRHEIIHTSERPFKCQHCQLGFNHKVSCTMHEKTCTASLKPNEKPHKCKHCGKPFARPYHLKRHLTSCKKNGELPVSSRKRFKCEFCEVTFTDKYAKNRHEKTHKCGKCGRPFARPNTRKDHEEICIASA